MTDDQKATLRTTMSAVVDVLMDASIPPTQMNPAYWKEVQGKLLAAGDDLEKTLEVFDSVAYAGGHDASAFIKQLFNVRATYTEMGWDLPPKKEA